VELGRQQTTTRMTPRKKPGEQCATVIACNTLLLLLDEDMWECARFHSIPAGCVREWLPV